MNVNFLSSKIKYSVFLNNYLVKFTSFVVSIFLFLKEIISLSIQSKTNILYKTFSSKNVLFVQNKQKVGRSLPLIYLHIYRDFYHRSQSNSKQFQMKYFSLAHVLEPKQ